MGEIQRWVAFYRDLLGATVLREGEPTFLRLGNVGLIQQSLRLMNLQIHYVLSDITGAIGLAILNAILAGYRDPLCLAHLCNIRVKSPRETVAQVLVGDYRPEHLFHLEAVAGRLSLLPEAHRRTG